MAVAVIEAGSDKSDAVGHGGIGEARIDKEGLGGLGAARLGAAGFDRHGGFGWKSAERFDRAWLGGSGSAWSGPARYGLTRRLWFGAARLHNMGLGG